MGRHGVVVLGETLATAYYFNDYNLYGTTATYMMISFANLYDPSQRESTYFDFIFC